MLSRFFFGARNAMQWTLSGTLLIVKSADTYEDATLENDFPMKRMLYGPAIIRL